MDRFENSTYRMLSVELVVLNPKNDRTKSNCMQTKRYTKMKVFHPSIVF